MRKVAPAITIDEIVYGGDIEQYQNQLDKNYTYDLRTSYTKKKKAISPNKRFDRQPQKIGGVDVRFLAANATGKADSKDTNNNSIALMLEYMTYKFFLMGDAEQPTEDFILKERQEDWLSRAREAWHGAEAGPPRQ